MAWRLMQRRKRKRQHMDALEDESKTADELDAFKNALEAKRNALSKK